MGDAHDLSSLTSCLSMQDPEHLLDIVYDYHFYHDQSLDFSRFRPLLKILRWIGGSETTTEMERALFARYRDGEGLIMTH